MSYDFDLEARINAQDTILLEHTKQLSAIATNLQLLRTELVGNGQPGKIKLIEDQVLDLRLQHAHAKGYAAGIGTIGGIVGTGLVLGLKALLHLKP